MAGVSDGTARTHARPARDGNGKTLLSVLGDWLRSLTGGSRIASLRESVEELIEEHPDAATAIDEQERTMLLNLLKFGETRVEDVMVPRADIVAVPAVRQSRLDCREDGCRRTLSPASVRGLAR